MATVRIKSCKRATFGNLARARNLFLKPTLGLKTNFAE